MTRIIRHFATLTFLWTFTMLMIHEASGQPRWAMTGAGCVPVHHPINQDLYFITAGKIKFKDNKTGTITVICPVSVGVGSVNSIFVSYRDGSGFKEEGSVQVALRRHRKRDGRTESVEGLAFNSNQHSETQYHYTNASTSRESGHRLDDANYFYFVQLTMRRSTRDVFVEFGGVELTSVEF